MLGHCHAPLPLFFETDAMNEVFTSTKPEIMTIGTERKGRMFVVSFILFLSSLKEDDTNVKISFANGVWSGSER